MVGNKVKELSEKMRLLDGKLESPGLMLGE